MVDKPMNDALGEFNTAAADVMGSSTPGYQPVFHPAMNAAAKSIGVPDPLSVAAPKDHYFIVRNPDGSEGYTRSGNFQVLDGELRTADDRPVLGFCKETGHTELSPLRVPAHTPQGWARIAADGSLTVIDPAEVAKRDAGHPGGAPARLPDDDGAARRNAILGRAPDAGEIPHFAPGAVAGEAEGSHAPAMGKPYGRLALAVFAVGTIVDNAGRTGGGKPLAIGMPEHGRFAALKTQSRDLGNVDVLSAIGDFSDAGTHVNAVMAAEQLRQKRAKEATDLIK